MTEDDFRQLEFTRTRALVAREMVVIEQLHAADYVLVTPSGRVFTRATYLAKLAEGPFYSGWEHGHMAVLVSPQMAAVRYQATLRFPSGRRLECWHTDLYQLRGKRWQAVWSQATRTDQHTA